MGVKKEYRKLILVPIDEDGKAIIEFDDYEWIEAVNEFNEKFLRVIIAGVA